MDLSLAQISSIATGYNQGRLDYTASEVSFYVNVALVEVATRVAMRPLEAIAISSTTSGENKIAVPPDFDYVLSLSYVTDIGGPLVMRDAVLLDGPETPVVSGIPRQFAVYADWIELDPTPNSAYSLQLRYGARMRAMVASTDTPNLSERYHYAVALKTAALLSAARNDSGQEALNLGRYVDYMGSTPSDQAFRQRDKLSMGVSVPRHRNWNWPR